MILSLKLQLGIYTLELSNKVLYDPLSQGSLKAQTLDPCCTLEKIKKENQGVQMNHDVHGLGLGTPVLGDHKFSSINFDGKPQAIFGDILQRLEVRESRLA